MRTSVLILLVATGTLVSHAQTSVDLLGDKTVPPRLYYYGYDANVRPLFTETYHFGDTFMKNNKTYQTLQFERNFVDGGIMTNGVDGQISFEPEGSATGSIGIRESNGRIYVDKEEYLAMLSEESYWSWEGKKSYLPYEQTDDGEIILYDFTKEVGDRFVPVEGHEDIKVVNVETLTTRDGVVRRVQRLSNGCVVIQGIGCINSPGMWLCYLNPAESPCIAASLIEMSVCGTRVFVKGDEYTTAIQEAELPYTKSHASYYNMSGQRIAYPPSHGITIQEGRKVLR